MKPGGQSGWDIFRYWRYLNEYEYMLVIEMAVQPYMGQPELSFVFCFMLLMFIHEHLYF